MDIILYSQVGVLKNGLRTVELTRQNRLGLLYLCQKEGQLVTKEELISVCWENKAVIVSDNTFRQSLYRLRSALAEIGAPEDTLLTQGRSGYIMKPDVIRVIDTENVYDALTLTSQDVQQDNYAPPDLPDEEKGKGKGEKSFFAFWRYIFPLLTFLFLFIAGISLRYLSFTHTISFAHYKDESGRSYFFSDLISPDKNREEAVRRINYWISKDKMKSYDKPFIYVSADWRDTLTFFSCSNRIELISSDCMTVNIIGRNKS